MNLLFFTPPITTAEDCELEDPATQYSPSREISGKMFLLDCYSGIPEIMVMRKDAVVMPHLT